MTAPKKKIEETVTTRKNKKSSDKTRNINTMKMMDGFPMHLLLGTPRPSPRPTHLPLELTPIRLIPHEKSLPPTIPTPLKVLMDNKTKTKTKTTTPRKATKKKD